MKDRRIGKFEISNRLIDQEPDGVRALLSNVIVLSCTYEPWSELFRYVGLHPDFAEVVEPVDANAYPPLYTPQVTITVSENAPKEFKVTWYPCYPADSRPGAPLIQELHRIGAPA